MLVDTVEPSSASLRAHLAAARPDVVVIDPMAYFAAMAAHDKNSPWPGLSTSLNPCIGDDVESELVDTLRTLEDARRPALHGPRCPGATLSGERRALALGTFALSVRALLGDHLPDDGVPIHLVGAPLPGKAASPRPGQRPLVYASLGSQAYHQPVQLGVVLEAARAVDARFVIAMGELASSPLARSAPSNVEVVAFAPQVALLAEASAASTRGGANSVHEALAHAVPLLVSPICNDQHHNAALVARACAGRSIDLGRSSPDHVASCLRALLALTRLLAARPEIQVATCPLAPLTPRRRTPLAASLHTFNLRRGFSSSRSSFNGKLFAMRAWDVPSRAALTGRIAALPVDPFYDFSAGVVLDDIFLSRARVLAHGHAALAETTNGEVLLRAPETWRGMHRYYRRMRRELERLDVMFPETAPTRRRPGKRSADLLPEAPFREPVHDTRFSSALVVCKAAYVAERAFVRHVRRAPRDPWPAIEETKAW